MKLLPPDELELLEIPNDMESRSPIEELVYATDTDRGSKEREFNLSTVYLEGARFNLFTGNQTLGQREQTFKVIGCLCPPSVYFKLNFLNCLSAWRIKVYHSWSDMQMVLYDSELKWNICKLLSKSHYFKVKQRLCCR